MLCSWNRGYLRNPAEEAFGAGSRFRLPFWGWFLLGWVSLERKAQGTAAALLGVVLTFGLLSLKGSFPLFCGPNPHGDSPHPILWMDEFLHHFETMGDHCLLVFTRESLFQGFLCGAGFCPSTVGAMFVERRVPKNWWEGTLFKLF